MHRFVLPAILLTLAIGGLPLSGALQDRDPPVTGKANPNLADFDEMMIAFVKKHKVPGATLAVTKDGRLVYSRGFGYADLEAHQAMEANSLMRVASVSKPITAVAILMLIEQGKLKLDDLVFDLLKIEPFLEEADTFDPRWKKITIGHLLQHRGGWDRGKSFDPMFRSVKIAQALKVKPPAKPEHIIRYMAGKPLQFAPGERYAYSNFGYCLLGRVIEKVTGQSYEDFVRKSVLAPVGIKDMKVGKTLASQRAAREAHYYAFKRELAPAVVGPKLGKKVPLPYGAWYLEAMDSHGGWIASAADLVRFASALDRPDKCPILKSESIQSMFARPEGLAGHGPKGKPLAVYYGCGWSVRVIGRGKINTSHNGLLAGTAAHLMRRWDGVNWAVIFNTDRGAGGEYLAAAVAPLVHEAADRVKEWPPGD